MLDVLFERSNNLSSPRPTFTTLATINLQQLCPDTACTWDDSEPLSGFNSYRLTYYMSDVELHYSNILALYSKAELAPTVTEFRLYPNPTNGPCRLQFESSAISTATLELVSMDGRSAFGQFLELQAGGNHFDLN